MSVISVDRRLPNEILFRIIAEIVPRGLEISGDPDCCNLETVQSLLRTSLHIKQETLRLIYRQPLIIQLTNAPGCGCCNETKRFKQITIVKKVRSLPIERWTKVVVNFVPIMQPGTCKWMYNNPNLQRDDPPRDEFEAALSCIARQSAWLARSLEEQYSPSLRHARGGMENSKRSFFRGGRLYRSRLETEAGQHIVSFVEVCFAFDSCKNFSRIDLESPVPLWGWMAPVDLLTDWRWVKNVLGMPQIRLPSPLAVEFAISNGVLQSYFPHQPQNLANYFQDLMWRKLRGTFGSLRDYQPERYIARARPVCNSFLNPELPLIAPRLWTWNDHGIIRVTIPEDAADNEPGSWRGEAIAFEPLV